MIHYGSNARRIGWYCLFDCIRAEAQARSADAYPAVPVPVPGAGRHDSLLSQSGGVRAAGRKSGRAAIRGPAGRKRAQGMAARIVPAHQPRRPVSGLSLIHI